MRACLLNLLPFLLYGVIMFGLLVVAMAPLFAGLVLWVPLAVISSYTSYRDIFAASHGCRCTGLTAMTQDCTGLPRHHPSASRGMAPVSGALVCDLC